MKGNFTVSSIAKMMMRNMFFAVLVTLSFCSTACAGAQNGVNMKGDKPMAYDTLMVDLISELKGYAVKRNPQFFLLGNGGAPLFHADEYSGNTAENVMRLMDALDGELVESVYYGWDMNDGDETPDDERAYVKEVLELPKLYGKPLFALDYVKTKSQAKDAYKKAALDGFVMSASFARELDEIPDKANRPAMNEKDIKQLTDVSTYLVLLNPGKFESREAYVDALAATPYDLLIIDLYFGDTPLSRDEVERLKRKPDGKRRLVAAYMSIGEAEDYRPYFAPAWHKNPPSFIEERNKDWEGNMKVRYWQKEWHDILFGSINAYLDKILAAGFDGSFLDVIDAYEYFQNKNK